MKAKDKFSFGKHKGETLDDVWRNNPEYIGWCVENIKGFKIEDKWIKKDYAEYLMVKLWNKEIVTEENARELL